MGKKIKLFVQKGDKLKAQTFSLERVRGVVGGPLGRNMPPTFQLELSDRAGRTSYKTCQGTVESLKGMFEALGVRDEYLFFVQVRNELTRLKREPVQESAIFIPYIAVIEPVPQPNKAKSVISRFGAGAVLASERFNELGAQIVTQGFKAAPVEGNKFMLTAEQQLQVRPKAAKKRQLTPTQASLI